MPRRCRKPRRTPSSPRSRSACRDPRRDRHGPNYHGQLERDRRHWWRSPTPSAAMTDIARPEQVMLTRSVQKLAQKMLDTDKTTPRSAWQQDGQQYTARVMRQPASDSTGIEQVVAEIMTEQRRQAHEDAPVAQAPGVLAFHAAREPLGSEHPAARRRHRRPLPQQHRDRSRLHRAASSRDSSARSRPPPRQLTFDWPARRRATRNVFQGGVETQTERVNLPRDMPDVVNGGDDGDRRMFARRHAASSSTPMAATCGARPMARDRSSAPSASDQPRLPHRRQGREALRVAARCPGCSRCTRPPTSRSKTTSSTPRIRARRCSRATSSR